LDLKRDVVFVRVDYIIEKIGWVIIWSEEMNQLCLMGIPNELFELVNKFEDGPSLVCGPIFGDMDVSEH